MEIKNNCKILKIVLDRINTMCYNITCKIKGLIFMFNILKIFSKKEKKDDIYNIYKEFIIKNKFVNHVVIKKNVLWMFKDNTKNKNK